MSLPRILLIGGSGQLGRSIRQELESRKLGELSVPSHQALDLSAPDEIGARVAALHPDLVVNAAAYTQVDGAEREPDVAHAANVTGPKALAEASADARAPLIHFSTDYVFDGAQGTPYRENDEAQPLNVYGRTKLAGEHGVLSQAEASLVIRTAWIHSPHAANFVRTMLRLAHERELVSVVADEVGTPTAATAIARSVARIIELLFASGDPWRTASDLRGVYHLTAHGETSRFDFARRILADDPRRNSQRVRELRPISSTEFGAPAARPPYSVLDNSKVKRTFGLHVATWEEQWEETAAALH